LDLPLLQTSLRSIAMSGNLYPLIRLFV